MALTVGLVMFPNLTQLDLTAPYEVFNRMPDTNVTLLASSAAPVRTEWGLALTPDARFRDAPQLDVLCVPGGWGVNTALEDRELLSFLRERGERARYVTSICSGALLLGAAGLLKGYRATTHWMSGDLLAFFGATLVAERVVVDRNRITGGGVTAGIDLALVIAATLFGVPVAQQIQLAIEYDPAPPFASGSPRTAPTDIRDSVLRASARALAPRRILAALTGLLVSVLLIGVAFEQLSRRDQCLRFPVQGQLVDIEGRRLQLDCRGNDLTYRVIGCSRWVYNDFGPGLLESTYAGTASLWN